MNNELYKSFILNCSKELIFFSAFFELKFKNLNYLNSEEMNANKTKSIFLLGTSLII